MTKEEWARKMLNDIKNEPSDKRYAQQIMADVIGQAIAEAMDTGLPPAVLTDRDLHDIKTRHAATTQNEWRFYYERSVWTSEGPEMRPEMRDVFICDTEPDYGTTSRPDEKTRQANGVFIAHAHQDIPAMAAHIEHLEGLFRDLANDGRLDEYRRGWDDAMKHITAVYERSRIGVRKDT